MPHEIRIDGERLELGDSTDVGRAGALPVLRVLRTAAGDAVVISSQEAMRDGLPMLGNLAIVPWGCGALIRSRGLRVEIVWNDRPGQKLADSGQRCRVCFGGFDAAESAVVCRCEALFHQDCDEARLNCPGCGWPRGECA